MPTYYAPAERNLAHSKIRLDCDPALVRAIWKARDLDELAEIYPEADGTVIPRYGRLPSLRTAKREAINHAAGFHGVLYLGQHRRNRAPVYYLNAGDPYAATLIFCGDRMTVGCWGDLAERGYIADY